MDPNIVNIASVLIEVDLGWQMAQNCAMWLVCTPDDEKSRLRHSRFAPAPVHVTKPLRMYAALRPLSRSN